MSRRERELQEQGAAKRAEHPTACVSHSSPCVARYCSDEPPPMTATSHSNRSRHALNATRMLVAMKNSQRPRVSGKRRAVGTSKGASISTGKASSHHVRWFVGEIADTASAATTSASSADGSMWWRAMDANVIYRRQHADHATQRNS
jgi:hypothetical protein